MIHDINSYTGMSKRVYTEIFRVNFWMNLKRYTFIFFLQSGKGSRDP